MSVDFFASFRKHTPWLEQGTIFLTRHGSHAYGLNRPESDLDVKGIAVPPVEYFFAFDKNFEQAESKSPTDLVIFSLRKFTMLASQCNPNIIEILFADRSDWLQWTEVGERLVDARDRFLSTKAKHTFSGYALSQLRRIQTHYRWLKNPPKEQPQRTAYGLPEKMPIPKDQLEAAKAAVRKRIEEWELDIEAFEEDEKVAVMNRVEDMLTDIAAAARMTSADLKWRTAAELIGYDANFIDLLDRERRYKNALNDWNSYNDWKAKRNPARAELEAKWGYDTKHAMHLVRLMRMGHEIVKTGKVIVRRPDRDELLAIRSGAWSYEQLVEYAERMDKELREITESPLPRSADIATLSKLTVELTEQHLRAKSPDSVWSRPWDLDNA